MDYPSSYYNPEYLRAKSKEELIAIILTVVYGGRPRELIEALEAARGEMAALEEEIMEIRMGNWE